MNGTENLHRGADGLTVLATVAVTASTIDGLEQGLRIVAIIITIAASGVALYQRLKRRREIQVRRFDDETGD